MGRLFEAGTHPLPRTVLTTHAPQTLLEMRRHLQMEDKAATSRRTPNGRAVLYREAIWSEATCRRFVLHLWAPIPRGCNHYPAMIPS
jgi:hypothetical protein